jgi:hypothetical protein
VESIDRIISEIHALEEELSTEIRQQKIDLIGRIELKKIQYEKEIIQQQKKFKKGLLKYIWTSNFKSIIAAPFLYSLVIPFLILDLSVSIYQFICFSLFRITKVKRSGYFNYDRAQLGYLNIIEKINCAYCSYANGLIAYVREVAGRTEQYWCPIKHAKQTYLSHPYYKRFTESPDAQTYHIKLEILRKQLKEKNRSLNDI